MASQFYNGPEQVIPSESYTTTDPDGYVRLKIPEFGKAIETTPPISIPGLLKRTAEEFPDNPALVHKVDNKWAEITYKEYLELVRTCSKGFIHLGLERRNSVCILGFNSPEWFISHLAAIFAGGIAVGIYTTNSPEACFYCADFSKANIIVVQDDVQLKKILAVRSKLPFLKAIIQYEGEPADPDVISWKQLLEIGKTLPEDLVDDRLKTIAINECCALVFTSGTVGNPKAAMISHDNYTWTALSICEKLSISRGSEVLVSYLPLSHVAAQAVDLIMTMSIGATVYFADKDALKGSLVNTLQVARPTKFLAVPRVWEKIYEKMQQVAANNGALKKLIASWAKDKALEHYLSKIEGKNTNTWGYYFASSVVFKKVKQALGLDRCTYFVSAAAPISSDIKKYFWSIDIPVMEVFGMSEASGPHTMCLEDATNLNTIGKSIPGAKSKILNPDETGNGELCMFGRNIFMGYLNDKEKTAEALDEQGWLHSGDLGRIDENGFIYITGRLKELLITAGGENIPPVHIEQQVQTELPHISNAFLVGDKRKFLSILLTLKTDVDANTGAPLDTLTPAVQQWLESLGCPAKTVTEVLQAGPSKLLLDAIQKGIDRVNQSAVSNAQKIQKFAILPADFSVHTGELGPTMKVKRRIVEQKYSDIIEKIYDV